MSTATERLPHDRDDRDSAGKITLPPPDWTAPRPAGALHEVTPPEPLTRRLGRAPAVEGALRAELGAARAARDSMRERVALSRFSRWLAAHGRSWDEAIEHARRALSLGEDEALRHELSGWLEGLGEAAAAAEVLDPLATSGTRDPVEAVRLLLHMGVLEARAGNAKAAAASFARAARLDPGEALASELLGTLGSWAPGTVLPSEAAESYVDAAGRRHTAQALDAQMEDLLRAFDVDPTSSVAVAALATALTERGRPLGADEVWRAHAAALRPTDEKRSRAVHARRRLQARAAGDLARALGAALDEGLDGVFGAEVGDFMDDLLLRAGLLEPLVARLEIRAESAPRLTRAALFEEIARLEGGPLANADRAASARVAALQADPTREDSLAALRAYASETRNATELVEGLLRSILVTDDSVSPASRAATARSLAVIADEALADPVLAAWALQRGGEAETGDAAGRRSEALVAYRASRERLEAVLGTTTGEPHLAALRDLAVVLRSFPDDGERNAEVLAALVAAVPGERRWYVEAIRLAFRRQAHTEVLRLARTVRDRPTSPLQDIIDAALAEAAARRATNDFTGANETTRGLVAKAPDDPRALAVAWMNASLAGDRETRSHAIEQLAKFAAASVRAVMYALAAETRALIGDREAPRRLAERACYTDPSSARAVATLADAAVGAHDRTAASALERGIHFLFARSSWCRGLAEALDAMGENIYAVGWTQRLVALRPGDRKAMAALLERVARTRDGARIAEALVWVLAQPQPAAVLADLVVAPLRDLVAVEAPRAVGVARRALEVFGAYLPHVREAVLAAADAAGDAELGVQTLERAIAVEPPEKRKPLLLSLRARHHAAGSLDGEARALLALARLDADVALTPSILELPQDGLSEDGSLYRLGALAVLALQNEDAASPRGIAQTMRDLGAGEWDLAGDHEGAHHALWRAAMANPATGLSTFAFDLAQLGGAAFALDSLEQRIDDEPSDPRAATMAADTARVAIVLGEPSRALDFAITALARNPRMAEALATAETAAMQSGREIELTRVYDDLTVRALGRFARRAVNYRAARFFEKQSDDGLALKHAARAFQAVPSEGAALLLLIRTAERAGDRAQAVGAMVQVAENTRDRGIRFAWLLRASAAAGSDEEGLALRVDVLLQALTVSRDPRASQALQQAARELLRTAPEERASLELRLARASKMVLAKADGPEGARLGLCFTRMALELFGDPRWASEALLSALTADADLEDYEALLPYAPVLATGGEVEPLFALAVRAYTNVGVAAFRLLARIAETRGENPRAADLWSRAAMRDPEDSALVRQADLALREHGDEVAWARFRKAVPEDERVRMFLEHAEARQRDGSLDEAARAFERAAELSASEGRAAIEGELRALYEASGHADRVEQRAVAEAGDESVPAARRAACWGEVAQLREMRGDAPGALLALRSAVTHDGTSRELWERFERLATVTGDDDARVAALRARCRLAAAPDRVTLWKTFARALEARDEFKEAEEVWRRVAADDPDDEEADHALEALISALRNYADLAVHLERRTARLAKLPGAREALRAVRLRRAAILEQRLGRTRDACAELALVLDESPDNVSALSYLADLHERLEEFASAVPIWRRVALLSRDPSTQAELELRAAHAALRAKDFAGALGSAKEALLREPGRRDATELRAAAARALGDDEELGAALEDLAASVSLEPRMRSDALVEASHSATRLGREHLALERARRAAEVAPERMATQILARALEYRLHGAGAPDEAAVTLAQLDAVAEEAEPEEVAVLAFLRAEAVDVVSSDGSGLVVLREAIATAGPRALLSLGIAERLAASGDAANALPAFEAALLGELHGFRDRGRVAFTAAETALRIGRDDTAVTLLREASAASAVFRPSALLKAAQTVLLRGDRAQARDLLSEAADRVSGDDRARTLAQLARLERDSGEPTAMRRAITAFEGAILAATAGSPLAVQLVAERNAVDSSSQEPSTTSPLASTARWGASPLAAPAYALSGPDSLRREPVTFGDAAPAERPLEARPLSNRPLPPPPVLSPAPPPPTSLEALLRNVTAATTTEERAEAQLALARAHLEAGSHDAALICLEAALEIGAREPGEVLASLYQSTNRLSDVVRVRRTLLALSPGDFGSLDALRSAASADRNHPYSRALEHVARLFDGAGGPVQPPPLAAQVVLPGFLSFLTRSAGDRVAQALALVWEDGHAAWGKDAIGVLQGAQPAATTNAEVARIYELAISLLGLPRVPLFLRPSDHPPVGGVSMTWPPAAVLTGRVREDTPELRYALGQALALTLPSNIITLGLSPTDARQAFRGIMGAFGPPESSRSMNKESGRLAEALWHVLPPRTQRRLQALLAPVQAADFEAAPGRAWQSAHRVGLFLAGDLRTAVSAVLSSYAGAEVSEAANLYGADWAALCRESSSVADLFNLAVAPEYAEARWHPSSPTSSNRPSRAPVSSR